MCRPIYTLSMPITFKSQATGNLVMLQKDAEALLKLIGKDVTPKGILDLHEMPAALVVLGGLPKDEAAPRQASTPTRAASPDADDEPDTPAFADEPVSLRQRAWPLIQMIERAQAAGKPIVWGV